MSQPEPGSALSRQILSALADGEASEAESADAFHLWREDVEVRATWHCYHLIGDVLRSDDLAAPAAGQQRLLAALRERLATEPVVLAPPMAAPQGAEGRERLAPAVANASAGGWLRAHWQAPVAMTAGFLAMVVGIQVHRTQVSDETARALVARAQPAAASVVAVAAPALADAQSVGTSARDQAEQLAPYVAAHRLSTMNAALQMPGSADIRNVSLVHPAQ